MRYFISKQLSWLSVPNSMNLCSYSSHSWAYDCLYNHMYIWHMYANNMLMHTYDHTSPPKSLFYTSPSTSFSYNHSSFFLPLKTLFFSWFVFPTHPTYTPTLSTFHQHIIKHQIHSAHNFSYLRFSQLLTERHKYLIAHISTPFS